MEKNNSLSPFIIFKETFLAIGQNIWRLLAIIVLPLIVTNILLYSGAFSATGIYSIFLKNDPANRDVLTTLLAICIVLFLIFSTIMLFAWSLSCSIVLMANRNKQVSLFFIFKEGLKRSFAWLWTTILVFIIMNTGYSFLIFPGVFFGSWFFMAEFITVNEKSWGIEAIDKSKRIVGINWKWSLINVLLVDILFIVLFYLIDYPEKYIDNMFGSSVAFSYLVIAMCGVLIWRTVYKYLLYEKMLLLPSDENSNLKKNSSLNTINNISCGCVTLFMIVIVGLILSMSLKWSSVNTIDHMTKDNQIEQVYGDIQQSLEIYKTNNGFYPPDNHIEYLWSGNRQVMKSIPQLPEECGMNDEQATTCGIMYQTGPDNKSYTLKPYYLDKNKIEKLN